MLLMNDDVGLTRDLANGERVAALSIAIGSEQEIIAIDFEFPFARGDGDLDDGEIRTDLGADQLRELGGIGMRGGFNVDRVVLGASGLDRFVGGEQQRGSEQN
jgi:hypothetical protein